MYRVSIIIPVYNVSRYIRQCLESVIAQTLQDIEVILVDDLGQDNSMELAREMVSQCQRDDIHFVTIVAPKNEGPGAARNLGIAAATGEYIAFLDSDDYIDREMYEKLYNNAISYQADLSGCHAALTDGRIMTNPKVENGELTTKSKRYILRNFVSNFTTFLFRREWLTANDLYFPKRLSGEDSCFMGECYLMAKRIALTDEAMYHYVIHEDSISHKKHVWRGKEKRKAFGALLDFAKRQGIWQDYRHELRWIYVKKALLTPIKEWIH